MNKGDVVDKYKYIILLPGQQFHSTFLSSWSDTLLYLKHKDISFIYTNNYSSIVSEVRNVLLTKSIYGNPPKVKNGPYRTTLFNDEVEFEKVIFIDSDMVWNIADFIHLIESPYPVTVGAYATADGHLTIGYRNKDSRVMGMVNSDYLLDKQKPFEVDYAGLGFAAIDFEVLKQLEFPYFDVRYSQVGDTGEYDVEGEDVYFFKKIQEKGYKIMCDPRLSPGHLKNAVYVNKP